MGERRALVIGSQCESLNLLSFLPDAARALADTLLDPAVGGCVPAVPGTPLLVDPTVVELDDAVTEAFRLASEDEATLFVALVGHGEYVRDDFYVMARDTGYPPSSRQAFLLAQRFKELLSQYSLVDGLVLLLDTCHAGIAAEQAAAQWVSVVGQAGRRFEVLTASDDRAAADGCFSRTLTRTLRAGSAVFGQRLRCTDLKSALAQHCRRQTALHLAFDGRRVSGAVDEGLWLAPNPASVWRGSPWADTPLAEEINRLAGGWVRAYPPTVGKVVGHALGDARCVAMIGVDGDRVLAALAHPTAAAEYVPARFLHALLLATGRPTSGELARQAAAQLTRTVPGFTEAAQQATGGADEFDYHVVGPLRALAEQDAAPHRVRIAVDLAAADMPRMLHDSVLRLAADGPDFLQLIITAFDVDVLPAGAATVSRPKAGGRTPASPGEVDHKGGVRRRRRRREGGFGRPSQRRGRRRQGRPVTRAAVDDEEIDYRDSDIVPDTEPPARVWSDADSSLDADFPPPTGHPRVRPSGRYPVQGLDLTHDELSDLEASVVLSVLGTTPDEVALPLSLLVAASGGLGGPGHVSRVREVLNRLRGAVRRVDPATAAERVLSTHRNPLRFHGYGPDAGHTETHRALAEAIAEVAPMTEHDRARPEHAYAERAEPVHLWASGEHAEALRSLDERQSPVPVENRERWARWLALAERDLGADHPLTLRAAARHATATAKAGDPHTALATFDALLPRCVTLLGPEHEDTLSLRHNIAYWLADTGQAARAEPEFTALAESYTRLYGPEHEETLDSLLQAAVAAGKAGDEDGALARFEALLPTAERALGADHKTTVSIVANLAFWGAESAPPPRCGKAHQAARRGGEGTE